MLRGGQATAREQIIQGTPGDLLEPICLDAHDLALLERIEKPLSGPLTQFIPQVRS